MKTLKFKFDLDSKVSIYVPSTLNVSEHIDNTAKVREVITKLSNLFGGATATEAVGGWVTEDGQTIIEHVTIVYSFCTTEQLQEHFDAVYGICEDIKESMGQEAVTLEINGQVKFV